METECAKQASSDDSLDAIAETAIQASPEKQAAGNADQDLVRLLDRQMREMERIVKRGRYSSSESIRLKRKREPND